MQSLNEWRLVWWQHQQGQKKTIAVITMCQPPYIPKYINMQSNSFSYSLKVWLTSVTVAPVIFYSIDASTNRYYPNFGNHLSNEFPFLIICIILCGVFSFLTWVLFLFIIKGLIASCPSPPLIKHLIAVTGVVLTAGTFASAMPEAFNVHNGFFYLMVANCVCIAGGSYLYKLENAPEAAKEQIKK